VRNLGFARTSDREIFSAAKPTARVFVTKDRDLGHRRHCQLDRLHIDSAND